MLQEGIYWESGTRPGCAWGLMFLRVRQGADVQSVDAALTGLSDIFDGLRSGRIRDLPGVDLPTGGLTILIGYGPKVFEIEGIKKKLPRALDKKLRFASPLAAGGGTILPGSGLKYVKGLIRNPATEEIVIQAIASTNLAVARVFVEIQKYFDDHPDPNLGMSPLELSSGYTGFNREDGRSWIDFHDGLSNIPSGDDRKSAIQTKNEQAPDEDRWTVGGSYLTFLRLSVNIQKWRGMSVKDQELAVGRLKISGCPIVDVGINGEPKAVLGCPFAGTSSVNENGNSKFREAPSNIVDSTVKKSHIHRSNHHSGPIEDESSLRIFRQGYEFLEPPIPGRDMQLGLNFVSFQDSLRRVFKMLTLEGWLGSTNFGGLKDSIEDPLLDVLAAGVFLCPPVVEGERYPGQSIFLEL